MKAVAIIALVFGIAGGIVAGYHLIETYPNYKTFSEKSESTHGASGARYSARAKKLETLRWRVAQSYQDASFYQVYAMWGLGGLALILSVLGFLKNKKNPTYKKLSMVGALLSVIVLVISLTTIMASRLG